MLATISLDSVEYVSLYTGNNGSGACTCKCPCCSQKGRERRYQGGINQAIELFEKLSNLKQLYLFGNPDVTVDTEFCHEVIKEAVRRHIHICLSTSGVGGKNVLMKLLDGISTEMIDYISFSFDAITEEEMSFLKGIKYPMEKALEGLEWAVKNGYTVKVQPTLWSCNYTKAGEIIEFFSNRGINWFTFHIGSLESGVNLPSHKHLLPEEVKEVHKQISEIVNLHKDIKVRCPVIYTECGINEPQKWYCMNPERTKELLVTFTEDGIKATHSPMASCFRDDLSFTLGKEKTIEVPVISECQICPFGKQMSGHNDTCCRYVSKYWNY